LLTRVLSKLFRSVKVSEKNTTEVNLARRPIGYIPTPAMLISHWE